VTDAAERVKAIRERARSYELGIDTSEEDAYQLAAWDVLRATGTCDACARRKVLRGDGTVPAHYLAIDVSRRATTTVGAARVRRRCPGSGRAPRKEHR
jgi:hypothetical protein